VESDASGAPNEFSAPFDATLGLVYTDVSPDGLKAQLSVKPDLLQPMGIVHGGVWCAMVESMASVSARFSAGGAGIWTRRVALAHARRSCRWRTNPVARSRSRWRVT
jgi:uncharacterized protein (TIGR00369 family)